MKPIVTWIAAGALLGALAFGQPPRYKLIDLGPVGPTPGQPYFISNDGLIAGTAATNAGAAHAVIWYRGLKFDIGTRGLGGPNSQGFGVNDWGQVVGEAETSVSNGEDFCGFNALGLTHSATSCRPFLWQYGVMTALPTLGGANGAANLINNRGEVAGLAENGKQEAGCPVGEFEPVVWENGRIRALPTLAGDPDGGAFGINDNGQVVGASGKCAPFNPNSGVYLFEAHALLWDSGMVTNLGSFGGTGAFAGNHACAINNRGQVVGHSDVTGDTTTNAFLWTKEAGMQNLHTLPGDFASLALNLNDRGEIVGSSFDANFVFRAFLWRNGEMMDLNTLIPANSPLYLQLAQSINSSGEIVGFGQAKDGTVHGFLATPRAAQDEGEEVADRTQTWTAPVFPSEEARRLLIRRLGIRGRS